MNRMNPILRFIIFIVVISVFQRLLVALLATVGLSGIYLTIVFELIMAFVFAYIYYPSPKQGFIKDPRFHKNVAIFFGVLILLQVIF